MTPPNEDKMTPRYREKFEPLIETILEEVWKAIDKFPPMNSPHEGYAILQEEVDELWDEIKIKQSQRDLVKMEKEAIQVAAMALRFLYDIIDGDRGRK